MVLKETVARRQIKMKIESVTEARLQSGERLWVNFTLDFTLEADELVKMDDCPETYHLLFFASIRGQHLLCTVR